MQIREALGYSTSNRFVGPARFEELPANELSFALRASSAECERLSRDHGAVEFEGAYLLQREPQSQAIPVLYLIRVESEEAARSVHQFVWNQNQAPFLIVESPKTIRIYPGFAFDRAVDNPLRTISTLAVDTLDQLAAFRAASIDDGTLWQEWGNSVDPSKRVDESLLRDLRGLDKRLQREGVARASSHALIGKFVYLRYLRDRDILSLKKLAKWGINPDRVFTAAASLEAFRRVNAELQEWLNGSVFPLAESNLNGITESHLQLVASVFSGAQVLGDGIQHALFDPYDFSHIPIETLSCVYEQFLHDATGEPQANQRGKKLGAYYTPVPLADYVLSEMQAHQPLRPDTKVLDSACGSGVFLVQSFRRLIEQRRRSENRKLKPTELRQILTTCIFGIDRDDDACRIAELSLIMLLLDYVQPPDLEGTTFKLPKLRDQNVFHGDFFEETGKVALFLRDAVFDWVVGNPPWAVMEREPSENHYHYHAFKWMKKHQGLKPTSGNQIAEVFVWKAAEHVAPEGCVGLVVPAMTWFKKAGKAFRERFFASMRVWQLANFANLAEPLFAGRARRPASVVFFETREPDEQHLVSTIAPFVAEQVANRPTGKTKRSFIWNITIDSSDVREIENSIAKQGNSLPWKLAMWGTSRDRKLLQRLDSKFGKEKFSSLQQMGLSPPHEGLQLRNRTAKDVEHRPELVGLDRLEIKQLRKCGEIFAFPPSALLEISADECYVRKGRFEIPFSVSKPPHVVVDASRRFAVYSDKVIVIPPRHIGISGRSEASDLLRALSLFLSSDFSRYHQFLTSPQWGIDASRADLSALADLPVPLTRLSQSELSEWAELQLKLETAFRDHFDSPQIGERTLPNVRALVAELNDRTFRLLGLRKTERWLVEDLVHLNLLMNQGKVGKRVIGDPTTREREDYLIALRDCLDGFLSPDRELRHAIEVLFDRRSALLSVAVRRSTAPIPPKILDSDAETSSSDLFAVRDRTRTRHSQWVYFNRALKIYQRGILYQFKPLQRLHWTRRQAVLDSDDIIAETLAADGPT